MSLSPSPLQQSLVSFSAQRLYLCTIQSERPICKLQQQSLSFFGFFSVSFLLWTWSQKQCPSVNHLWLICPSPKTEQSFQTAQTWPCYSPLPPGRTTNPPLICSSTCGVKSKEKLKPVCSLEAITKNVWTPLFHDFSLKKWIYWFGTSTFRMSWNCWLNQTLSPSISDGHRVRDWGCWSRWWIPVVCEWDRWDEMRLFKQAVFPSLSVLQ